MKKAFKLLTAVGLSVILSLPAGARVMNAPRTAGSGFRAPYIEQTAPSPMYKFPTRPSEGILNMTMPRTSTTTAPMRAPLQAPDDINLIGFIPSAAGNYYGYMYNVPYRPGRNFEQASTMMVYNSWGGVEVNGTYYTTYQISYGTMGYNYLNAYNTTTWMSTRMTPLSDFAMFSTALAKDPNTDEVYGCFINADYTKYEFGVADFENATRTTICDIDPTNPWAAAAMDAAGTMYVVDVRGVLHTVDKATGALTTVGDTGVRTTYFTSMCYDAKKNRFLRSVCNDTDAGLYQIDPATAKCELLCDFPNREQVLGLFIGGPLADNAAPEAPADVKAEFPEGGLEGTVSFTVPDVTFGGQPAEGEINWQVYGFYQVLASGKAAPGEKVNAAVKAPYAGQATFQVTLSNAAGNSPKSSVSCFIGRGTPTIPVPYIEVDGYDVTIHWDPVTSTYDGGYINPDEVTYTVTRFPDYAKVAEHISETSVIDHLPQLEGMHYYQYQVVAENGDKTSGYGSSLRFTVGIQGIPYFTDFSSFTSTDFYTIVDVNNDGALWTVAAGGASIISYKGDVAMDDWLITPALDLKAGHDYFTEFTFRSLQQTGDHADIEIMYGPSADPVMLTNTLNARTNITELAKEPVRNIFSATTDGACHIGVHAIATAANWPQVCTLIVKDAAIPNTVENLTITPQPYPAVAADLKFNAPTLTAAGKPLASISKIEIVRGGVLQKTFEDVQPGQLLEWEDVVGQGSYASGDYMWTITVFNEVGEGLPISMIETIGLTTPGSPAEISATEEGNTGNVTLKWSHVDYDVKGRPLAPEYIQYRILNGSEYVDNAPVITTDADNFDSYTYQAAPAGEQAFAMMGVQLYNDRSSSVAFTPVMAVGTPYSTYHESVAGGELTHTMASIASDKFGFWQPVPDDYYEGYRSADGDGGLLVLPGNETGVTGTVSLGKFDLATVENPALMLNVMNVWGEGNPYSLNLLQVYVNAGLGFELAEEISLDIHDECDPGQYARKVVDLSKYANKGSINIALRGIILNYNIIAIDNIHVLPLYDHNLAVANISAPLTVRAGNEAAVSVMIDNLGKSDAEGYSVVLSRDGRDVGTIAGEKIAPFKSAVVTFADPISVLDNATVNYSARVDYDADKDLDDNESDREVAVEVIMPKYPAPTALEGSKSDDGSVNLSWTEPVISNLAEPVVEGFEDGEPNVFDYYGEWTFVDRDGAMTDQQVRMAFMIFEPDPSMLYYYPGLAAYDGNRYLSAWVNSNGEPNDDWAISPELSGTAQTISFFARSLFEEDGGESFRVLYSTGSLDPDDFIEVRREDYLPATWLEYTFDLPEGARFFAINCVSEYQYTLLIDNVTYIPAGSGAGLELVGYNVYRDGMAVNAEPVAQPSFVDVPTESGTYDYTVTALYDAGESTPANHVTVDVALGVADAAAGGLSIDGGTGVITVTGATGCNVSVMTLDGKVIATAEPAAKHTFRVAAGFYLVKAGDTAVKVIVK